MTRPHAFETDDGALRCYLDQLPPDRCVFCNDPAAARLLRVAGPMHYVSAFEQLADGGTAERVVVGMRIVAAVATRTAAPAIASQSLQTKGRAWLSVCKPCSPKPGRAALVGLVALGAAIGLGAWNGLSSLLWIVLASLVALVCFTVALRRLTLRVGEIDEDDHMFKLRGVAPEIARDVIALGPAPHPQYVARHNQLALHTQGSL